ncbi:hypothetical protein [Catenulispora rubra]|uniref:hypothetical protein n=1 Tax=Catenulispora rubra TaxID=280293 RepID=UPI00189276E3|nr:hypothetical protein [Catenulispora rubra]
MSTTDHTLAEHWNGTKWSASPTPDGTSGSRLAAVAAVSPTNAWAAGYSTTGGGEQILPLFEHWNGSAWSIVPGANEDPQGDNSNTLFSVVATGPGSLTAVGAWSSLQQGNPGSRTLAVTTTHG